MDHDARAFSAIYSTGAERRVRELLAARTPYRQIVETLAAEGIKLSKSQLSRFVRAERAQRAEAVAEVAQRDAGEIVPEIQTSLRRLVALGVAESQKAAAAEDRRNLPKIMDATTRASLALHRVVSGDASASDEAADAAQALGDRLMRAAAGLEPLDAMN